MFTALIRTLFFYLVITIAIRLMGKRQIGDMQPNELVVTLLISELAAIPLQDMDQPILSGISAIVFLVIIEILVSVASLKSFFVRKIINGQSVVIIKNGAIDQKAMQDVRMTVLDLVELLRGQEVFDISQVAFAVLEVNGELSVLLKNDEQPVTKKDAGIKSEADALPLPVITDGKIVKESLKALEISNKNITDRLKKKKLTPENVFLMTLDRNGTENIVKREAGL
mgnify:FL=1